MKIAILHYHLRPGGTTTVIRNAARALRPRHDVQILADFGYNDNPARSREAFLAEARALARRLAGQLKGCRVLHTHNLTLGKHPRLTAAVRHLAAETNLRMINQVHDFAEDNRPAQLRAWRLCTGRRDDEFWRAQCYYDRPNVRWATLTTHDAAKLATRGIPAEKIHVLPNPIDTASFTQPAPPREQLLDVVDRLAHYAKRHRYNYDRRRKLLLSPMKVMVRKNNAEAVELIQRLRGYQLLITLDAASPRDRTYSAQLKRRIRREHLPVVIGFGRELANPLPLFHLAHAILTTSTTEGFGYTFVEGWLCHKLVIGRNIPDVTRDFVAEGMELRHLYGTLNAPAVHQIRQLLRRPPRQLIERNRNVVLGKYSLAAYARRFETLVTQFT